MEILGLDWNGNKLWEIWRTAPCCGGQDMKPDPKQCITCLLCHWCCSWCTFSKVFASAAGQGCAIVNHLLFTCCCSLCAAIIMRHNARVAAGGNASDMKLWLGDVLCVCCCGPCSYCQILRALDGNSWNLIPDLQAKKIGIFIQPPIIIKGMIG